MHSVTCSSDKAAAGIWGPNLSLTNTSKFTYTWKLHKFLIADQQLWTTHFPSQTSLCKKSCDCYTEYVKGKRRGGDWQWNILHRTILKSSALFIIKSFYSLWSTKHPRRASRHYDLQLFLWPHSIIFLFLLFHPLLSFATFSSAHLFSYIPDDSNPMLFSLLLLLHCVN